MKKMSRKGSAKTFGRKPVRRMADGGFTASGAMQKPRPAAPSMGDPMVGGMIKGQPYGGGPMNPPALGRPAPGGFRGGPGRPPGPQYGGPRVMPPPQYGGPGMPPGGGFGGPVVMPPPQYGGPNDMGGMSGTFGQPYGEFNAPAQMRRGGVVKSTKRYKDGGKVTSGKGYSSEERKAMKRLIEMSQPDVGDYVGSESVTYQKKKKMKGGGLARKGVGMALKGGGLARKGVGMALKSGGIVGAPARSARDMRAGAGSGVGRIQKTKIARGR